MRGTVYKRKLPSGAVVWQAQLDAGRDENGKRIRITKSFARKGEAEDGLDEMKCDHQDGLLVKKSPKALREYSFESGLNSMSRNIAVPRQRNAMASSLPTSCHTLETLPCGMSLR